MFNNNESFVKVKNVYKNISERQDENILIDISLSVKRGEFVSIMGPSGSGKSTLLGLLAGIDEVSKGNIFIDGIDITKLSESKLCKFRNENMGIIFQSPNLIETLNAVQNIEVPLIFSKSKDIANRSKQLLNMVGLKGKGKCYSKQLSGGEAQRVAIARALATEPTMLLLDEPMSNLDVALRVKMREEIREIQQKIGITTLFITHDQQEALAISDKIAVMKDGRVLQVGTPMDIYNNPANDFVANFVGTSNLIDKSEYDHFGIKSEDKEIYVRPEQMILVENIKNEGFVKVKINSKKFLGSTIEYTVSYKDKKYNVVELNRLNNKLSVGSTAYLGLMQGE